MARFAISSTQIKKLELDEIIGECETLGPFRVVDEATLGSLFRSYGFGIAEETTHPAVYRDLIYIKLMEPSVPYLRQVTDVVIRNAIGDLQGQIFEGLVRRILGPILIALVDQQGDRRRAQVVIHAPNRRWTHRIPRNSVFHIYPFAIPRRWHQWIIPPIQRRVPMIIRGEMVGVNFEYRESRIGREVAPYIEQIGNSFYLRYSFRQVGLSQDSWYRLHEHHLIGLRDHLLSQIAEPDETIAQLNRIDRARFVATCEEVQRIRVNDSVSLDQLQLEARELQRKLTSTLKQIRSRNNEQMHARDFGSDFDKITQMEGVKSVTVARDGRIVVETKMIYCRDPTTNILYEIGEFLIILSFDTSSSSVPFGITMLNLTRTPEGFHAPHVAKGGLPCWGSLSQVFPDLMARQQYAVAVEMALKFLSQVNMSDPWGANIRTFKPVGR